MALLKQRPSVVMGPAFAGTTAERALLLSPREGGCVPLVRVRPIAEKMALPDDLWASTTCPIFAHQKWPDFLPDSRM
jgi:hypothetical protein